MGAIRQFRGWSGAILLNDRLLNVGNKRTKRGGGLGSSTIFKKFNEPYAPL